MKIRGNAPSPSLQSRLEAFDHRGRKDTEPISPVVGPTIAQPVSFFQYLEASGRFHRDSGFGRIFHPGRLSFRENVRSDSLHIVVHHNVISAHVDRVSPLALGPEGMSGYSMRRATAHNVSGMAQDLVRLLRGRQGDHRSHLDCEWMWTFDGAPEAPDLLDPETSAWSLQLEARVSGSLDESQLRRALAEALSRQPTTHDALWVVDCPDDISLDRARVQLYRAPVAVTEWPPLRAQLARHPGGDVLMLNLNHAASDGFGALTVLRSIAQAYAGEEDGHPRPDFLAVRDLPVRPPASDSAPLWVAWYRDGVERLRDLLARPAQLAPDEAGDAPGYGFHMVRLSADESRGVVDVDRPGTTTDVLLAALHLAIGHWNRQHGAAPGRQIGALVVVDLRPSGWREEKVGNFSVTARVSTTRRQRAGFSSALQAITAQTARNKRTRTGIALLAALDRSGLLALWAKQSLVVLQPLTRNRLVDTAVLAPLGPLEPPSFGADAGDTVEVWFSAPARGPLSLCIGTATVSGRLHLCFRYPHRLFSADAARRFADCYLAQIRSLGENPS